MPWRNGKLATDYVGPYMFCDCYRFQYMYHYMYESYPWINTDLAAPMRTPRESAGRRADARACFQYMYHYMYETVSMDQY